VAVAQASDTVNIVKEFKSQGHPTIYMLFFDRFGTRNVLFLYKTLHHSIQNCGIMVLTFRG